MSFYCTLLRSRLWCVDKEDLRMKGDNLMIDIKRWLKAFAIVFAIAVVGLAFSVEGASKRPNLVFVFSDQQSWDMLGCYGNSEIITPHLDRFASEGIQFNHCISSSPICTPYRAMLLSGQHTLRNGAFGNDIRMLPGYGNYFAEVLRDNGYRTGYYGKWHLYGGNRDRPIPPGPYRYGFDHEFLSNNCTLVFDKKRAYYWNQNGEKKLYGEWEPFGQTKQAIEFINTHADKPFALFLSWHPPHNPYGAPEDLMEMYNPDKLTLRANTPDNKKVRRIYHGHMAMITGLDQAFGQLMESLKHHKLAENTIVVFTSDHGDALLSHGNRYNKMRPEQESLRVPLLVRYPEELKPRKSDLLVGTLDLMPTILGMMKLPIPETCDGLNLTPFITAQNDNAVDAVPIFLPSRDFRGVYTRRYTYCYDSAIGGKYEYRDKKIRPIGLHGMCCMTGNPIRMRRKTSSIHQNTKRSENSFIRRRRTG